MKDNNSLLTSIKEYVTTGRGKELCFQRIYQCVDARNIWRYLHEISKMGFNENNQRLADVHEEMFSRAYQ